jgi:predicted Zn-dependent protease
MPGASRWTRHCRTAVVALFGATTLGACATNPVTGKRELALVSEEQEIQMGRQAAQEVAQTLGLVDDDGLQQYVQRVGASLAADTERPGLPWTFRVVEDPTPNAFALPGGFIFVTRGMMTLMNSEAELASVLGHEIGHVTARHSVEQISRAQLAQLGLGLGAILAPEIAQQYGQLAGTGLQLLFLKYGRDDERQADELGFRYALQDNYDVREFADVFADLQRLSQASSESPVPNFLSTHPDPGERVETARRRVAALNRSLDGTIVDRAEYLQRIDGLAYGENPRNGFFRDGTFIHPDLRFRLDFPARWQAQNLPQAVVAVSPQ